MTEELESCGPSDVCIVLSSDLDDELELAGSSFFAFVETSRFRLGKAKATIIICKLMAPCIRYMPLTPYKSKKILVCIGWMSIPNEKPIFTKPMAKPRFVENNCSTALIDPTSIPLSPTPTENKENILLYVLCNAFSYICIHLLKKYDHRLDFHGSS